MLQNLIKFIALSLMFGVVVTNGFAQTAQMDAVANESGGQYAPMNMGYAGFNSLGMTQAAWLDPMQNLGEGQSRPAYSKYYWSPDLVLPIRLREGMITLINFPSWEMVEDVFIGDNATFDGQISGPNTVLLYPRKGANVGVDTNVIIFGRSGNRYVFYVKSEAFNTERLTNSIIDIEVIGDENGQTNKLSGLGGSAHSSSKGNVTSGGKSVDSTYTRRFLGENWLKEIPLDPAKFRFDIEVYVPNPEDVVIAPERVWRDDIFTYIDFGDKALNMNQRPIATMLVERLEVPVGFRTKGPNGRLMIVEGIGDMVLRNGKRIICLKLRRGDDEGLDFVGASDSGLAERWDVGAQYPTGKTPSTGNVYSTPYPGMGNTSPNAGINSNANMANNAQNPIANIPASSPVIGGVGQYDINVGGGEIIVPQNAGANGNVNVSYQVPNGMQRVNSRTPAISDSRYVEQYGYGSGFSDNNANISIELGTDSDVSKLETLWENLSRKNSKILMGYSPFFSVDAPADGQGKELFHLRVGPVNTLEEGDSVCGQLGRNGVFCSVVRTQ